MHDEILAALCFLRSDLDEKAQLCTLSIKLFMGITRFLENFSIKNPFKKSFVFFKLGLYRETPDADQKNFHSDSL